MAIHKILVVDDSGTDLANLKNIVASTGCIVSAARSGREAIELAAQEKPDLILMDIVMDEVDGYAACREIKKNPATNAIPVVFVSSKHQKADRLWAVRQGGEDLISKPYTEEQILDTIRALG